MKNPGVYFLKADNGVVKIGRSANPQSRVNELKTSSPVALVLIFVYETVAMKEDEAFFHRFFANRRVRGEWFALSDEEISGIIDGSINPSVPIPNTCTSPVKQKMKSIPVRFPENIYASLVILADEQGISLNSAVVQALRRVTTQS